MGMQFIQIPRKFEKLTEGTKFVDVLVYAAIDYQKDSTTKKSRIGMRTISEKYAIPLSKVEAAVKRLKEAGYIDYTQIPSPNNPERVFNEYTLPLLEKNGTMDGGYLKLDPSLLTQGLKPKEKGVLIYLQLLAVIDMNDIAETKIEDIASRLGITRQTTSKYLKFFLSIGQIDKGKHFYKCRYLAKDTEEKIDMANNEITLIL